MQNRPYLKLPLLFILTIGINLIISYRSNAQVITTVAGSDISGHGDTAYYAYTLSPQFVTFDGTGNLYFASYYGNYIYKIDTAGILSTYAGNGNYDTTGDGGPATAAGMFIMGLAADAAGNVYFSDVENNRIRKINTAGIVTKYAGTAWYGGYGGDGGPSTAALLNYPFELSVDGAGNLIFFDMGNYRVRKITPSGIITTVAGTGVSGHTGDGGPAINAEINEGSLVVDHAGNIYLCNTFIRKINTAGIISVIAGNGTTGQVIDGAHDTASGLGCSLIAVDDSGNIFLNAYSRIYRINTGGIIHAYAGNGTSGFGGDNGPSLLAEINSSGYKAAMDRYGNLYFGDDGNERIRMIRPEKAGIRITSPTIDTICPANAITFTALDSGSATYHYQWQVNDTAVGTDSVNYTAFNLQNGDLIDCVLLNAAGDTGITVSNIVYVDAHAGTISGIPSLICDGATYTLTETIPGGTWSTTNLTATVASTGILTGVSIGIDTAIYSLTSICGPVSTQLVFSVSNCLTSIQAVTNNTEVVHAYPNPTTDLINISGLNINDNISLFDMTGKETIGPRKITKAGAYTLSLKEIPQGLYILVVTNGEIKSREKIVKI